MQKAITLNHSDGGHSVDASTSSHRRSEFHNDTLCHIYSDNTHTKITHTMANTLMQMQTHTYTLPVYWASYLINGDASGNTDEEIAEIDAFCYANGLGWASDCTNQNEFAHTNDANNIGGAVADFHFLVEAETPPPAPTNVGLNPIAMASLLNVKLSKAGRSALRKKLTILQSHLPKLPVGVVEDPSNAGTHRWPLAKLSATALLAKAVALGVTDFSPYGPNAQGAQPQPQPQPQPQAQPEDAEVVTPQPEVVTPERAQVISESVEAATQPESVEVTVTLPEGVVRVSASKAFGMKHKALKGIMVDVFPVGHCSHVPAVDPNMYMGYEDGKLLADILRTMGRVDSLGEHDKWLSNLWLAGQRGTGKSCIIKQVAAVLRRPLHVIKIRPTTTVQDLLGDFDIRSVGQGEDAQLWVDGTLTKAVKEAHSIVVLDEYSRGTQLGVSLNGPLQDRCLQITELGIDIPFADGVNMIVTDNSVGVVDDSGVFDGCDLDVSQIERWPTQVIVDYLPKGKEVDILMAKVKGLPKHLAETMVDVAGAARKAASTDLGDPRFCPSLRLLSSWALAMLEGRDMKRSFKQTMLIGLPNDTAEAGLVILADQVHPEHLTNPLVEPSGPKPTGDEATGDEA